MCGLVGVFGKLGLKEKQAFQDLLIINALRGLDSTGMSVLSVGFKPYTIKSTGTPIEILETPTLVEVTAAKAKPFGLIGHGRAATRGSVNNKNAHPFHIGNIVGTHNGTLVNIHKLDDHNKFDTDSEAIFNTINNKGIEHTWARLDGAAALVWYDMETESLNLVRNWRRPLFFTTTEDDENIFWASEKWMLEGVLDRRDIKHGTIYHPLENSHFIITLDPDDKIVEDSQELTPIKIKPVYSGYHSSYNNAGPYPNKKDFISDLLFQSAIKKWHKDREKVVLDKEWEEEGDQESPLVGGSNSSSHQVDTYTDNEPLMPETEQFVHITPSEAVQIKLWCEEHRPAKFNISNKSFYRTFKECAGCLETMENEYDNAVILDGNIASCESCAVQIIQGKLKYYIGA